MDTSQIRKPPELVLTPAPQKSSGLRQIFDPAELFAQKAV
jgi:hypothetical protein